jgi:hypothetical protein
MDVDHISTPLKTTNPFLEDPAIKNSYINRQWRTADKEKELNILYYAAC